MQKPESLLAVAQGLAGALAALASVLPWLRGPITFERLTLQGLDLPAGRVMLAIGLLLLADAVPVVPGRSLRMGRWGLVAAALALCTTAGLGVRDVNERLARDLPGLGVHPGHRGPGLGVGLLAAAAAGTAAALTGRRPATGPEVTCCENSASA